jgi:hypothetical protein
MFSVAAVTRGHSIVMRCIKVTTRTLLELKEYRSAQPCGLSKAFAARGSMRGTRRQAYEVDEMRRVDMFDGR